MRSISIGVLRGRRQPKHALIDLRRALVVAAAAAFVTTSSSLRDGTQPISRAHDVVYGRRALGSADGGTLAEGSRGRTVLLWDVRSDTRLGTLKGLTGIVDSVAFSPRGRILAAGGRDGAVLLWDVHSHRLIQTLNSHRHPRHVRRLIRAMTKHQLPEATPSTGISSRDRHFKPRYNPWDERLCAVPNGDLFKAIRESKASVVTDRIVRFTERGILLESGSEVEADIIVTATGLNLLPVVDDPTIQRRPLLDFHAGYALRAVDLFPRQGPHGPWTVEMNYAADRARLRRGPVADPALRFTASASSQRRQALAA